MDSIHNIQYRSATLFFSKSSKSRFLSRSSSSSGVRPKQAKVINIHVQYRQNRKKEHAPLRPLHDVNAPRLSQYTRRCNEDPIIDMLDTLEIYREVKERGKLRFIPSNGM